MGFEASATIQPQTLPEALLGHLSEIAHRCVPRWDREAGHLIAAEDVVGLHLFGHLGCVGHSPLDQLRGKVVIEQGEHLCLPLDVFSPRVAQAFHVADQLARKHAKQRVVGFYVVGTEVMGIIGGDQLNAQLGSDAGNAGVDDAIFDAAMILDLQVEVVAKSALIPAGNLPRRIGPALQNRLGNFASQAGSCHD